MRNLSLSMGKPHKQINSGSIKLWNSETKFKPSHAYLRKQIVLPVV